MDNPMLFRWRAPGLTGREDSFPFAAGSARELPAAALLALEAFAPPAGARLVLQSPVLSPAAPDAGRPPGLAWADLTAGPWPTGAAELRPWLDALAPALFARARAGLGAAPAPPPTPEDEKPVNLPQLIGPPDGGAGQIINPWPLANALACAALAALLLAGLGALVAYLRR